MKDRSKSRVILTNEHTGNTSLSLISKQVFRNKTDHKDHAQIDELNRLAMMYTRNFEILRNLDTLREGKMVRSAAYFALILNSAAKEYGLKTEIFKTFDKALDFLREKSGLREIRSWFQKTATTDQVEVKSIKTVSQAIDFLQKRSNLKEVQVWLEKTAMKKKRTVESLKTFDDALNFLRKKINLNEMQTLLEKTAMKNQGTIDSIIDSEKGNNDSFTGLWNLHFSSIDQIKDFARLKQVVFDYKAWFAFIVQTEKKMSLQDRINWYGETAPFNKWNKERVFLSLIIAMTLESNPRPYTMKEILLFIEKIGDFQKWVESLEQKFMSIIEDDGIAKLMWKHSAMNGAIEFLRKPQNRSVPRLIEDRNIRLEHYQKILYDSFKAHLKRAFVIASEYEESKYQRLENKTYLSWTKEKSIIDFNQGIRPYDPISFTKAIRKAPSLIQFLDENNLFRLYICSVGECAPLRDEIKRVCNPEIVQRIIDNISETITAEQMVQMLWKVKDMNGIKIDAYLSDDQTRWAPLNTKVSTTEGSVYKQIVQKFRFTIGSAPLDKLLNILIDLDKRDVHIGTDFIDIPDCMALMFTFKKTQIPRYITQRVLNQRWYNLVNKIYTNEYYSENIQKILLDRVEYLKLEGADVPGLKDAIRKYHANAL